MDADMNMMKVNVTGAAIIYVYSGSDSLHRCNKVIIGVLCVIWDTYAILYIITNSPKLDGI